MCSSVAGNISNIKRVYAVARWLLVIVPVFYIAMVCKNGYNIYRKMYKIKWTFSNSLYATWGAIVSFTQDIQAAMLGLIICIGIDTLTGFIAAPYRGQVRKSAKLKAVVGKIITYSTAIISLHILETLLFPDYGNGLFQLAKCACSLFGGLEIYSIMENCYSITGLRVFYILTQFTTKKIEEKTGVSLDKVLEDKGNK